MMKLKQQQSRLVNSSLGRKRLRSSAVSVVLFVLLMFYRFPQRKTVPMTEYYNGLSLCHFLSAIWNFQLLEVSFVLIE